MIHLHLLRVRQIDKLGLVGLQLDISTFFEIHIPNNNFAALFQEQVVHHPERDVNIALLG